MSGGVPAGELLPCAFCGGTDLSVETYDVQPDDYHGGYVTCTDCDAQGAGAISVNGWLHDQQEARAAAITAWNTRATPTPPIEGRDADVERVIAEAIGKADAAFGYSFNLTRLVDGEATHTLTMPGFEPVDFEDLDEGYALIAERRNAMRAAAIRAALQTLGERG